MNLDENFRLKLQRTLRDNISYLENKSIDLVNNLDNDSKKVVLNSVSDEYNPFRISKERAIQNINTSIESGDQPILKLRNDDWAVFRENEIEFKVIKKPAPPLHTKEELQFRVESEDFLYKCFSSYWLDTEKNNRYAQVSDFLCFQDLEFPIDELSKIQNKGNIYNVEFWIKYIADLVEMNFPEFKFDKTKSNRIVRFLKPLNENFEFGFEYDLTTLKSQIKNKDIQLPDYFNIIVINKMFDSKAKIKSHIFNYNDNIISLGILGNPFFYPPCRSLYSFSIVDLYHYGEFYPDNTEPKSVREYKLINEGNMKILHSDEYGEKLKKYAFFYMDLLGYSSKGYLDYLEKCILEAL